MNWTTVLYSGKLWGGFNLANWQKIAKFKTRQHIKLMQYFGDVTTSSRAHSDGIRINHIKWIKVEKLILHLCVPIYPSAKGFWMGTCYVITAPLPTAAHVYTGSIVFTCFVCVCVCVCVWMMWSDWGWGLNWRECKFFTLAERLIALQVEGAVWYNFFVNLCVYFTHLFVHDLEICDSRVFLL